MQTRILPRLSANGQQRWQREFLCKVRKGRSTTYPGNDSISVTDFAPYLRTCSCRCDGGDKVGLPRQGLVEPLATSLSSTLKDQTRVSSPTSSRAGEDAEPDEDLYDLQDGRNTLPNTPPTPHSRLASPPPLPPVLPTLDPQVQSARKAQTDRASAQLAQKMLQGWTLLGEECSNESCHSVPLMRRPPVKLAKKDGEDNAPVTKLIDPRRHCVICQGDYVREGDLKAYEEFMAAVTGSTPSTSAAGNTKRQDGNDADKILHSAAAKKRRFSTQPATSQLNTSKVMGFGELSADRKGKSRLIAVSSGRDGAKACRYLTLSSITERRSDSSTEHPCAHRQGGRPLQEWRLEELTQPSQSNLEVRLRAQPCDEP